MNGHSPHFLADEVERVLYDSSPRWEGIDAQEIPLDVGGVILRKQPGFAVAMPLRFNSARVEEELDSATAQVENLVPWCLWIIGPSSQPSDLEQRLLARNFVPRMEWQGLALTDLALPLPTNPAVVIEPLSRDNADAYATAVAESTASPYRTALLYNAQRFLNHTPQEVQIFVARLDEQVVGYAVLRIEPNGTAYLRNAMTVPAFRQRGVYLSLVAHRLAVAREAGCNIAVLQALTHTSAPILMKNGFTSVCRIVGFARKRV